jgi:hypothetical protein
VPVMKSLRRCRSGGSGVQRQIASNIARLPRCHQIEDRFIEAGLTRNAHQQNLRLRLGLCNPINDAYESFNGTGAGVGVLSFSVPKVPA